MTQQSVDDSGEKRVSQYIQVHFVTYSFILIIVES